MKELNNALNELLVNISLWWDNIIMITIFLLFIRTIIGVYNILYINYDQSVENKYDEYKYYSSEIVIKYSICTLVEVLILSYLRHQKVLGESDNIYICALSILLVYMFMRAQNLIAYTSCYKYCNALRFDKKKEMPSKYKNKNENELLSYKMRNTMKVLIKREELKMEILKYLVSPAIIVTFIDFFLNNETESISLLWVPSLILSLFLWVTYKKLNEYQLEFFKYESLLYELKNRDKYSDDEIKEIQNERYSKRYFSSNSRMQRAMDKAYRDERISDSGEVKG